MTEYPQSACNTSGLAYIVVTFDTVHGDLPALIPDTSTLMDDLNDSGKPGTGTIALITNGDSIGGHTSIRGTTEMDFCNNRGNYTSSITY